MSELGQYSGDPNLIGGRICLDFTNTIGGGHDDLLEEYLCSYTELVLWGYHAGLLTSEQGQRLLTEAAQRPTEAAQLLTRAIALRESLYRLFSARAAGLAANPADLAILNEWLAEVLGKRQLMVEGTNFTWVWPTDPPALAMILWPVVQSAAELLTSPELAQVRECAGEWCGWLFLDMSKNHSRRWCAMRDCGNRAKAKRFYQRNRQDQQEQNIESVMRDP